MRLPEMDDGSEEEMRRCSLLEASGNKEMVVVKPTVPSTVVAVES